MLFICNLCFRRYKFRHVCLGFIIYRLQGQITNIKSRWYTVRIQRNFPMPVPHCIIVFHVHKLNIPICKLYFCLYQRHGFIVCKVCNKLKWGRRNHGQIQIPYFYRWISHVIGFAIMYHLKPYYINIRIPAYYLCLFGLCLCFLVYGL